MTESIMKSIQAFILIILAFYAASFCLSYTILNYNTDCYHEQWLHNKGTARQKKQQQKINKHIKNKTKLIINKDKKDQINLKCSNNNINKIKKQYHLRNKWTISVMGNQFL